MLVAGGIDLSVGATYSLAGVTAGWFALRTNAAVAILLGIGIGVLVGLVNGVVTTRLRINALIATLAMSFVVGGCAAADHEGQPPRPVRRGRLRQLARTEFLTSGRRSG